jgi:hypothetical protein
MLKNGVVFGPGYWLPRLCNIEGDEKTAQLRQLGNREVLRGMCLITHTVHVHLDSGGVLLRQEDISEAGS